MQQDLNILRVDKLSKYFGGLAAVSNCSIKIKKGSITGIIGPNGSGKTTLFNLIAGNLKPSDGNVLFQGEDITGTPSYELISKGLLRTFQIAHEFTNLTVLENLMMVPDGQSGEHLMNAWFKTKIVNEEEKKIKETSFDYWLQLSTLEKPIYLPIKTNNYFEKINGKIKNFVQINFKDNKLNIPKFKEGIKIKYISQTDKIALDLGLNNLFATNNGDLFGRKFSKLLKKYDKIVTELAKNRQKQKLKTASKRYKKLRNKIKNYLKNEINRVINNIIKTYKPKEIIIERLNFQSPKLSKKLNRLISNFGKKIITDKFKNLKDEFGIIITEVNPAYTSQTCSKCGYVDKRNRKNQETFICGFCHKKQNADINASKNILARSSSELKDIFTKKAFILDKTVKCFIEQHKVMLLFILKKDIGESNVNNLSYNSLANTLTSNSYLKTILNDEFLSEKAIPF